ncbi:hypothetical protein M0R45_029647 [Rubus argutus]|uniref:Uncharacterized protein n=1 Tax=Rubus argutus TaxID=59490 RepID=A0AAW1W8V9_RUBAR
MKSQNRPSPNPQPANINHQPKFPIKSNPCSDSRSQDHLQFTYQTPITDPHNQLPILCLRRTHEAAASSLPALASPSAPLLRPVAHLCRTALGVSLFTAPPVLHRGVSVAITTGPCSHLSLHNAAL